MNEFDALHNVEFSELFIQNKLSLIEKEELTKHK
jgi:hypothetical protein